MPLIPPPPPPLNIAPSRARRRLADRLALHKQQAIQEAPASGIDPNDPFASLGDNDEQDATDPFNLDEDEQDITASGNRNKTSFPSSSSNDNSAGFSVSRGLTSLFSTRRDENFGPDEFEKSLEDSSSSSDEGSGSDPEDREHPPLESRRSLERQPLDVDDDEEMGEMVAPEAGDGGQQSNSSDEEELSEVEKEKLRGSSFGSSTSGGRPAHLEDESEGKDAKFQDEDDEDEEEEEGDELVEIAMPVSVVGEGRRNSIGRS